MANTGFKIQGADLGDMYLTKQGLLELYPTISGVLRDGRTSVWGSNNIYGVMGDGVSGYTTALSGPTQVFGDTSGWSQISGGELSITAVKTDGTLWSWGSNEYGQLGNGSRANTSVPVQTVTGGANWKSVSSNSSAVGAIKTDGTLWTWGFNNQGQLGSGTNNNRSSPVQTVAGGTNWKQLKMGTNSCHAIKTDGTLWGWGSNNFGQLGDNTTIPKSSPVQTIAGGTNWKQVSASHAGYLTGAIKTDGTLWMWGNNMSGEVGDNTITWRSSPVQTVAGGTNWKQVAIHSYSSGAASVVLGLKTDGTLWTWGIGNDGGLGLGIGDQSNKSSPVQLTAGGQTWYRICGESFSPAAILNDGALITWGRLAKWHYSQTEADMSPNGSAGQISVQDAYAARYTGFFSAGNQFRDAMVLNGDQRNTQYEFAFIGIYDNTFR